jgi:hypothetical protein
VVRLPAHWLRHTIIVEPYLGEGGAGPLYGPPVRVRCHLEQARESQRRSSDRAPRDSTVCIVGIGDADTVTLDARITAAGRVVEVLSRKVRTYPGTPVPEHVELAFI